MKLRYELSMSVEAAEERLNQHINSDHHLWVLLAKSRLVPFYNRVGMFGKIQVHKLWLAYIWGAHPYPRRYFRAQFLDRNGITVLQGTFRYSFFTVAAKILAYYAMILIITIWDGRWAFWIPTGLIMGSLYISITLLYGIYAGKSLDRKTEEFLRDLYAAELVGSSD